MKKVVVILVVAAAVGALVWLWPGPSGPGPEELEAVARAKALTQGRDAISSPPRPRPKEPGPGTPPPLAQEPVAVAGIAPAHAPDSSKGYLQSRLESFIVQAQLTPAQTHQLLQVLYDVKLNWRAVYRDFFDSAVTGENTDAADGSGLLLQAEAALVEETEARVSTFLDEKQMRLYRLEVGAFIWAVANAVVFVDDSGTVLPSP